MRCRPGRAGGARDRRVHDAGALTLGYVIIVPVFLVSVMATAQASLWFLARQAALAAARQGAGVARVPGGTAQAGVRAAVAFARTTAGLYLESPEASAAGSDGQTVQITVRGRVPSLVPGVPIEVSQVARAPVERFTTP